MRLTALGGTVILAVAGLVASCGARTGLPAGGGGETGPPVSSAFCVRADFASGYGDVGIYLLLDASLSMDEASKWDHATAAVAALVDDPAATGLEMGLQFFPLEDECDPDVYAKPAVALDFLPANATKIKAALARRKPDGTTPMAPALRGAIAYVRALRLADPLHDVAVVLVTDGAPDSCQSSTRTVVDVVTEAVSAEPRVSTFVVGLANGYVEDLNRIAAAGGTGRPVLISADPSTAQQLVTTFKKLRDERRLCQYAVPPAGAAQPTANDLSVTALLSSGGVPIQVPLVAGPSACTGAQGFYVDDPRKPTFVALCPQSCAYVHSDTRSTVKLAVGCGEGAGDGGAIDLDAGPCINRDIICIPACGSMDSVPALCEAGRWKCPPGSVVHDSCTICPAVPHGCCKPDGTLANAACVASQWVCPPGATIFGSGSCKPPDVCAPLLPCAPGQYCRLPDASCGNTSVAGKCAPVPASCAGAASGPVCGCDGAVYGSACLASAAGVDISVSASCTPPSGTFRCGPLFCLRGDEVCRKTMSMNPDAYACVPESAQCPAGCNTDVMNRCSLCECPPGRTCPFNCSTDSTGARSLTCTIL